MHVLTLVYETEYFNENYTLKKELHWNSETLTVEVEIIVWHVILGLRETNLPTNKFMLKHG